MLKLGTWLVGLLVALGVAGTSAAAPVLRVTPRMPALDLVREMEALRAPVSAPTDPDAVWSSPSAVRQPNADVVELRAGDRWVGRVTLQGVREGEDYVVAVPMPQVDLVRIWWRTAGGPWQQAQAGDRLPMSQWPFANPFPAFSFDVGPKPVDVVLAVENAAFIRAPVNLLPDNAFRENLVKRASLSGVMMGLGGMVVIVCVLGAIGYGGRARWMLAAVSGATLVAVILANGYLTVWFTGEFPVFNDWSRSVAGMVLAGLMVLLCVESLDPLHVRPWERAVAVAAAVVPIAYCVLQLAWLPTAWRVPVLAGFAAASVGTSALLCTLNTLRGGRHTAWIFGAIASMLVAPLLVFAAPDEVAGLDLRAAGVGGSIYVALMLIRQALMLRDRHGRDVLGRDALGVHRDPLTALWSYDGFQQRHAEAALREAAGQGTASVMMFALPGLDSVAIQHGSTTTERTLVRFAAVLQRLLGQRWALARVSRTRFAAISLRPLTAIELGDTATQVMAHCARVTHPVNLINEFDLRIACSRRRIADLPLPELLHELKRSALALAPRKRIVYLQPMPAAVMQDPESEEVRTSVPVA